MNILVILIIYLYASVPKEYSTTNLIKFKKTHMHIIKSRRLNIIVAWESNSWVIMYHIHI